MLTALSLVLCLSQPVDSASPRYLRLAGEKWVLESEIYFRDSEYVSVTHRAKEKMTLRITYGEASFFKSAESTSESGGVSRTARVAFDGTKAKVTRDEKQESFSFTMKPIVTTAPDWSDILWLARRYDHQKAGKQDFEGLWIHPIQPTQKRIYSIEKNGEDTFTGKDRKWTVDRFRVTLRSGEYLVWADRTGHVLKLMPPGRPQQAVVLEGFEEHTRKLN